MNSLFMVMLGGRHPRANTEVHDVVMAVGHELTELYPQLKAKWFGAAKGLHIDAWMNIQGFSQEGKHYRVELSHVALGKDAERLYMVNLGGYDQQEFGELHRYVLVKAAHSKMAKQLGKKAYAQQWQKPHVDHVIDVDDCIKIEMVGDYYVHVLQSDNTLENTWENTYITL